MQYLSLIHISEPTRQMTEEEQLELLASDGMLVKSPLAVTDQWAFPGFREKEWEDHLAD